jgi:hypothetical protein
MLSGREASAASYPTLIGIYSALNPILSQGYRPEEVSLLLCICLEFYSKVFPLEYNSKSKTQDNAASECIITTKSAYSSFRKNTGTN